MTSHLSGAPPAGSALLHVTLVPSNLEASLAFYDGALAGAGLHRHSDFPDEEESGSPVEAVAYSEGDGEPVLWIVAGKIVSTGTHIAFAAASRVEVERFWVDGLAAGGSPRQAPRAWELYRRGYFGAILADPDGNLVEAVTVES